MNSVVWYYMQKTVDGIMTIIDEISKNVESKLIKRLIKK